MSQLTLDLGLQIVVSSDIAPYRYDESGDGWDEWERPGWALDDPWNRRAGWQEETIRSGLLC